MLDLEHAMLGEQFQSLLETELAAEKAYCELIGQIADPSIRQDVEQIHRDKLRHVQLAERLVEIVE